ncbi:MAG: hypothetical protein QM760_01240 [Nibricoccus sp.]
MPRFSRSFLLRRKPSTPHPLPADTPRGYVARLLINETPFPGENFWVSEEDTCSAQAAIIWVLRNRLNNIPAGYTQWQVAAVTTDENVVGLLTAGGVRGQVDGLDADDQGRPVVTERVTERVTYLLATANSGNPGRFARIINHAQKLADEFTGHTPPDRFAAIKDVDGIPVTGSAYTDG